MLKSLMQIKRIFMIKNVLRGVDHLSFTAFFILKICFVSVLVFPLPSFSQLPDGFVDEMSPSSWDHIAGFVFDEENRMYAWERAGRLYKVENDKKTEPPILDISEEVAFFLDHGMLAVALHPNFTNNGYVYLNYAVDRHHLLRFGTTAYDPNRNATHEASIGRLTRYTLDKNKNFSEVVPGSRKVLIGTEKTNGVPLLHGSHGIGDLLFGVDGSLLVAYGDGSSFEADDAGSHPTSYYLQALADGIISEKENVGAYRSQLVDCHNGKILRIDPETGEGLPSNPFYDPEAPSAPRSRVWALGLRNPFRMSLVPGTGEHDPELGQPGELMVSDVGAIRWEELNHITRAGQNFGWPLWEGFEKNAGFRNQARYNLDAPNPLACESHFYFHDLVVDSLQNQLPHWLNPCDSSREIKGNIPLFTHRWPVFAYNNVNGNPPARTEVAAFDNEGKMYGASISQAIPDFEGEILEGICIIDGAFGTQSQFSQPYQDAYFFADYGGWIKALWRDSLGNPAKIEPFHEGPGKVTHLDFHPGNGCLYYIDYKEKQLHKVCFDVDPAPLLNLFYDRDYGPSPLTVFFDASSSRDPEGQPISFLWKLGDGTSRSESSFSHTFLAEDGAPKAFRVSLTLTDSAGKSRSKEVTISVNNTPPQLAFSSFQDGDYYAMDGISLLPLEAEVFDLEHAGSELSYSWQLFLHHNSHFHPELADTNRSSFAYISPAGCTTGETFYYRISLSVADAAGLSSQIDGILLPNCDSLFSGIELSVAFVQPQMELHWEVEKEKHAKISRIEVQRAPDRLHFQTLGEVVLLGENQQIYPYGFSDFAPLPGKNVYRLKLFTTDGKYNFSQMVESTAYDGSGIQVFPNPATAVLAFRFEEMKGNAVFELFDLQGKIVMQTSWQGQGKSFRQLSVAEIQSGMYYYRIQNGGSKTAGKVIIK